MKTPLLVLLGGVFALFAGGTAALGDRGEFRQSANPSGVVAAEIGFNQLAQSDGQWTAFRKTADKDAVMFAPQVVKAQAWLSKRPDPAQSVKWWPEQIYMSCDGSYGASTGGWERPDGTIGYFTTIWRRQKKGDFKWIVDHGDMLPKARAHDDAIEAKVAQCANDRSEWSGERARRDKQPVMRIADPPPSDGAGQSNDGTLRWRWRVTPDGARSLTVSMRYDGKETNVIEDVVLAPAISGAGA